MKTYMKQLLMKRGGREERAAVPCRLDLRMQRVGERMTTLTEVWCETCQENLLTVSSPGYLFAGTETGTRGRIYRAWDAHVLGRQPIDYQI